MGEYSSSVLPADERTPLQVSEIEACRWIPQKEFANQAPVEDTLLLREVMLESHAPEQPWKRITHGTRGESKQ